MSAVRSAARTIEGAVQFFHFHQDGRDDDKSQSGLSFTSSTNHVRREVWVIKGCSRPTADTLNHLAPQKQRYAFRALVWLLKHSNDKKLINEVLEYVNNYPEMVLDSGAGSQAHFDAILAVARHFHRLQHDAIEWHDLDQFRANCGRFMYLNARPWLHSADSSRRRLTQKVFEFLTSNSPFMGAEEVKDEIQALKKKKLSADKCTLWLEQQAVKITLGCPPDAGLSMCKALFEFVTSKVQIGDGSGSVHAEEIYSTLAWMFLNTAIDSSDNRAFWPAPDEDVTFTDTEENNQDSKQVANFDSTLTLSYFRHSETRQKNSLWLKTVGLSGILYAITYVYDTDELEPDLEMNHSYYEQLIRLLQRTLQSANKTQDHNSDLYIGRLPVYSKDQIRLYEFDSLKYCRDALDRAIQYSPFARFRDELKDIKNSIPVLETPEDKRTASASLHSKSELDMNELPTLPAHPSDGSDMV
ncbi:unnamed protein product [Rhizoctonia solani]|uniref:Uncharacterized protein n=1 Tax=Rhizoctonia solani TaxID=456999 RepID=A0A8H2Y063_9AGAM|nr:unnamed protein product [Rhizoctonia solani]